MTRALSDDLRKRVIEVVDSGLSRHAAAERFAVGVSTIKWVRRWRNTGSWARLRSGGDVRSHRIEAYGDEIMRLVDIARHHVGRSRTTWNGRMASGWRRAQCGGSSAVTV